MSGFIEHFHFLRPMWLLALLLLPLLAWLWRRRLRHADPWRRICDPQLLPHLSQGSEGRLQAGLMPWLAGAGFALGVLALAGPAFRMAPQAVVRLQSPLVIAVDLSDHMRAADLKPERIARVRFKLADLLAHRKEGQTALIGYAGDAFTVAPLTDDAGSLADLATALSPDIMPLQGQRADRAIELAMQLLRDAGHARGDLLIFTDQVDARGLDAAARAEAAGLRVSALGVGTAKGAPVSQPRGGFLPDGRGGILLPKLDSTSLMALARAGGGRYAELRVDDADLRSLGMLEARADADAVADVADASRQAWHDEGPWLLLLLLPLAALAFRRGWLGCVLVVLMLPGRPAQALDWSSLWQRPDQRAWQALQQGDAETARALAQDPAIGGAAAYRAGEYDAAIQDFAAAEGATADYNRGNALAKAEQYQQAIDAYDQALAQQADFPDAIANRNAVEDWMRQAQKQKPQNQQQQGQDGRQQDGNSGGQSGQDEQDASASQDPSQAGNEDGGPQDGSEQQKQQQDEQQQGDEQQGDEQQGDEQTEQQQGQQPQKSSDGSASDESAGSPESDEDAQARADDQQAGQSSTGRERADGDSEPPQPNKDDAKTEEASQRYAQQMQQALDQTELGDEQAPKALLSTEEREQQQAMEHLLQRVPDDPGGLLRRKFQLEYQRRQQEGGRQ